MIENPKERHNDMTKSSKFIIIAMTTALALPVAVAADPAHDKVIALYGAPSSFSAARGKTLFLGTHTGGKPATPSCSTCHTQNPRASGRTRAGKVIKPMAVSKTPSRFTDPKKVAKWARRNCKTVLGRECTKTEIGDILTYLNSI
jgi:mono/diheme cytochrome c family protein